MKKKLFRITLYKFDQIAKDIALLAAFENSKKSVTNTSIIHYIIANQKVEKEFINDYSLITHGSNTKLSKAAL